MTQYLIGTRRIAEITRAATEHMGGEVLTSTQSRRRTNTPRAMHWSMKIVPASRRIAIELLPNDDSAKRRTPTPSRSSRRGYFCDGSS